VPVPAIYGPSADEAGVPGVACAPGRRTVSRGLHALGLESIRNKLLAFAVLATLIRRSPRVVSYVHSQRSLTEKIAGEQHSVSAQAARELDLWLRSGSTSSACSQLLQVSENLERMPRASKAGAPVRQGPAYGRLRDYLNSVRDRFADYLELMVIDPDARIVANTANAGAPQAGAVALPPDWLRVLKTDNAFVGEPFVTALRASPR